MSRLGRSCACAIALLTATLGGATGARAQGPRTGWLAIRSVIPSAGATSASPRILTVLQSGSATTSQSVGVPPVHIRSTAASSHVWDMLAGAGHLPVHLARTTPLDRFGGGEALERLIPELKEASYRYQIGVRIAF